MSTAELLGLRLEELQAERLKTETPKGHELIDGELVEKPAMSTEASWVALEVVCHLRDYGRRTGAGTAFMEAVYRCWPERKLHSRRPGVSFVSRQRLPAVPPGKGEMEVVPEVVVEVVSTHDSALDVSERVDEFLAAGVSLVWVIEPPLRRATIYQGGTIHRIRETDDLDGGDVLPGFRLRLGDVLLPATA